jgi:hypothetical protein
VKRAPGLGLDLGVYVQAVPLLVRNPSIIVIPLLMAVVGVLIGMVVTPYGGGIIGGATSGLAGLIVVLLELFGLGAACIIADDAWRHTLASFDRGWAQARTRGAEILFAALGITFILFVAQYVGTIIGPLALILVAAAVVFLIWAIPAAAVGGVPGSAAIQISIDRVRANPAQAAILAVVTVALVIFGAPYAALWISIVLFPYTGGSAIVGALVSALLQAIALGYVALVTTKTYTDAAFSGRW